MYHNISINKFSGMDFCPDQHFYRKSIFAENFLDFQKLSIVVEFTNFDELSFYYV